MFKQIHTFEPPHGKTKYPSSENKDADQLRGDGYIVEKLWGSIFWTP